MRIQICNPYKTPKEVAHKVKEFLKYDKEKFTARPRNPWRSEESLYWLFCPKEAWPAHWPPYKYGKIFFSFDNFNGGEKLFVGLHVEKGLSAGCVSGIGGELERVMDKEWVWYKFIRNLKEGKVKEKIQMIGSNIDNHIYIKLSTGPLRLGERYFIADNNEYWLRVEKGGNQIRLSSVKERERIRWHGAVLPANSHRRAPLGKVYKAKTLAELTSHIERTKEFDDIGFYWINFYVGASIPKCPTTNSKTNSEKEKAVEEILDKVIEPWDDWLKPTKSNNKRTREERNQRIAN